VKKISLISILIIGFFCADAQSKMITEVFKRLPADEVYDLTTATRDSMLKGKTYHPSDNDSSSVQAYNYGYSPFVEDYMYVSMSFETDQRGSGMIEIRSFKTTKGDNLIFVSKTGGVWQVTYSQHSLKTFIYDKNKKLIPFKKNIFPAKDETILMKSEVADSVKKVILDNSNLTFNFSLAKPTLALNSDYLTDNTLTRRWLKGNRAEFIWNGDRFIVGRIYFE
jgi:hypothetical protein